LCKKLAVVAVVAVVAEVWFTLFIIDEDFKGNLKQEDEIIELQYNLKKNFILPILLPIQKTLIK
jgi:hypothetical protein